MTCPLCGGELLPAFPDRLDWVCCDVCRSMIRQAEEGGEEVPLKVDPGYLHALMQSALVFYSVSYYFNVPENVPVLDLISRDGLFTRLLRDQGYPAEVAHITEKNLYAGGYEGRKTKKPPVITLVGALNEAVDPGDMLAGAFATKPDLFFLTADCWGTQGEDWFGLSCYRFAPSLDGLSRLAEKEGYRLISNGRFHFFLRNDPVHFSFDLKSCTNGGVVLTSPGELAQVGARCYMLGMYKAQDILKKERGEKKKTLPVIAPKHAQKAVKKRPKILIDGVFFQFAHTGITRVWKELFAQWSGTDFAEHLLILDRGGTLTDFGDIPRLVIEPDNGNDADQQALLQHYCDQEGADLFISTYYSAPLYTPSVMLVHDMIPEVSGRFDLNEPIWQRKRASIDKASHYICVSENTSRDLRTLRSDIKQDQVTVAHNAISTSFNTPSLEDTATFLKEKNLEDGYYLFVGLRGMYKNFTSLVKAFKALPDMKGKTLVILGPTPLEGEFKSALSGTDFRAEWAKDGELPHYYAGATALVYPSLYEGFGLPLLEAMACGCPVVTTDVGILREVGGDAPLYFNPNDPTDLPEKMLAVRDDATRTAMRERGYRRSQEFSWEKTAEIYQDVLLKVGRGER